MNKLFFIIAVGVTFAVNGQDAQSTPDAGATTKANEEEPGMIVYLLTYPALDLLTDAEKAVIIARYLRNEKTTNEVRLVTSDGFRCIGSWITDTSPGKTLVYCRASRLPR